MVVGDETEPGAVVQDSSQLVLACPVERGIVTDWRTQLAVWRRALSVADISARGAPVVLLSPPLMPSKSLAGLAQAALAPDGAADDETAGLGAASLCIVAPTRAACRLACGLAGAQQRQQAPASSPAAPLWSAGLRLDPALGGAGAPFSLSMGCCVVVDAGFSGVTVAPYVYALGSEAIGTPAAHDATPPAALPAEHCIGSAGGPDSAPASTCVASGLRRGPVGGRLLGGLTRDWISFRSVDLSDDVTLARAVAERAGIVPLHGDAAARANAMCSSSTARRTVRDVALLLHRALAASHRAASAPCSQQEALLAATACGPPGSAAQCDAIVGAALGRAASAGIGPGRATAIWLAEHAAAVARARSTRYQRRLL